MKQKINMPSAEIVRFNLEGEICPYALIQTIKKTKEIKEDLESGKKILKVTYDHPPAVDNIPGEVRKRGFQIKIEKIGAGKWEAIIKK